MGRDRGWELFQSSYRLTLEKDGWTLIQAVFAHMQSSSNILEMCLQCRKIKRSSSNLKKNVILKWNQPCCVAIYCRSAISSVQHSEPLDLAYRPWQHFGCGKFPPGSRETWQLWCCGCGRGGFISGFGSSCDSAGQFESSLHLEVSSIKVAPHCSMLPTAAVGNDIRLHWGPFKFRWKA